jgi:uncharacterized protein YgiB involved in biofilm formation
MKRSRNVALVLMGALAFSTSGCGEEKTEAAAFSDLESCLDAVQPQGWFTAEDCTQTFAEAKILHDETAPRYESLALCEAEHGPAACAGEQVSSGGGGGIFMPLLAGYMIGQAFGGGRAIAQPMVKNAGGGFSTPDGGTRITNLNTRGQVNAAAFTKAPVTKGLAPMTKTQVQSRGGFGGSAAGRSIGG